MLNYCTTSTISETLAFVLLAITEGGGGGGVRENGGKNL